ncbi:TPA: hypothetical protein SML50_001519 [Serratia fonticola]|nr:hypothetical protein [Serratia fonticola]
MTTEWANFIATLAGICALVFFVLFDKSKGWKVGIRQFKSDFISYCWPLLKVFFVFTLGYLLIYISVLFVFHPIGK